MKSGSLWKAKFMVKTKICKQCKVSYQGRGVFFCSIICRNKHFAGKRSFRWNGGLPSCVNCSKKLSRRDASRCKSCCSFGKLNNNWRGGRTMLVVSIRNCAKYKNWRLEVYKKDWYTCQVCKIRNGLGKTIELHADHFPKKLSTLLEENKIKSLTEALKCMALWDVNNGRVLCADCHSRIDNFSSKFKPINK